MTKEIKQLIHVDADEATAKLIESIVSPKGYGLLQSSNGKETIDKLKEAKPPYDLAIVGDQLDDIDGIGWIIQLRKVSPKIKVILITKVWPTAEMYGRLTKELKIDLVVVRPIKSGIFSAQVDSLLSGGEPAKLTPEQLHSQALEGLRTKYLGVIPERLKNLEIAVDLTRREPNEPKHLEEAIRLAHNLKGTSGSCGFLELSEASAHLERTLKSVLQSGVWDSESIWKEVELVVDFVRKSAHALACDPKPGQVSAVHPGAPMTGEMELGSPTATVSTGERRGTVSGGDGRSRIGPNGDVQETSGTFSNTAPLRGEQAISAIYGGVDPSTIPVRAIAEQDMDLDQETLVYAMLKPPEVSDKGLPIDHDPASIRVLVMSDEAPLQTQQESDGLPVKLISTSNPDDALSTAKHLALDAALIEIDVDAPNPGITLARNLRGLPGNENLPVAFVSTTNQPGDPVGTAHAGASLYLKMPIKQEALTHAVEYLLSVRTGGRPRILIIDDDEDFARIIATVLGTEGMIVKALHEPRKAVDTIGQFAPDVVLLDVMMPGTSGYIICKEIREHAQYQDLPILFLTAQTGLDARLAAFQAGGDDYLPKPVAPAELMMRVKVRLERSRMLRERADKDVLTGLMIRRAFMEQLQALVSESKNHKLRFSLCLLDIDHFKKVNDTYGHLAGDRVLSYFGQLLRRRFRVEDLRGRWGGEEFIVAFRHIDPPTAKGALERCLEEFKSNVFEGDNGQEFTCSFSAGMVAFPADGELPQELIKYADECLYRAKHQGRSQVVVRETNS